MAAQVGTAMVAAAELQGQGGTVYEYDEIKRLAKA